MRKRRNARDEVLEASRAYYAHRAYYEDLLIQRRRHVSKFTKRELAFLEHAFQVYAPATRSIKDVLDVACGNGRHVIGLASRGYQCTGLDYTAERVQIAKNRAKRQGVSVKLLQGDATRFDYENEFDAVLALYILFLLPNDDDVLETLRCGYRALRKGGILICNIGNPFYSGKDWFSLQTIYRGLNVVEDRAPGIRITETVRLRDFDPIHGVAWWQETNIIEAPDGTHVFRDRERLRLLTYWDLLHYLQAANFKEIKCYTNWKIEPPKKRKSEALIFIARKD
jgi:SAM-dependent methyltransferase